MSWLAPRTKPKREPSPNCLWSLNQLFLTYTRAWTPHQLVRIMHPSRKYIAPHRKVRSGCIQCKRRRVKCDETRPNCRRCIKVQQPCSYMQHLDDAEPRSFTTGQHLEAHFTLPDLELLHHWTTTTSLSMGPGDSYQLAMREVLPRLALASPYLI